MLLRDEEFDTLESLCCFYDREPAELMATLEKEGYVYSEAQKQFRPIGYDNSWSSERRESLLSIPSRDKNHGTK